MCNTIQRNTITQLRNAFEPEETAIDKFHGIPPTKHCITTLFILKSSETLQNRFSGVFTIFIVFLKIFCKSSEICGKLGEGV